MLTLRMLGGFELSDDAGGSSESLLSKPKPAALLAYLAIPRPGTWHRRDNVVATFWPDNDQGRARSSLRSAVLVLRRGLPDDAIHSRGDEELSIAADVMLTDVAMLHDDVAAGRFAEALDRYKGELLPGVFVSDSPEFDAWLARERAVVRDLGLRAATQLSLQQEAAGNLDAAIDAAHRAADLSPENEANLRRWVALLDRVGDRAQAFAVYDRFRTRLAETLGVRPSSETVALLEAIRTRQSVTIPVVATVDAEPPALVTHAPRAEPPPRGTPAGRPIRRNVTWVAMVFVAALAVGTLFAFQDRTDAIGARDLVVLPMENGTGDSSLAYIASGIADGISRRLGGLGSLRVASGARSTLSTATQEDLRRIARELGASWLLRTQLHGTADSLRVTASRIDAETLEESPISSRSFSVSSIRATESILAADVAGALFRIAMPTLPRSPDSDVDERSYALMLEGWHRYFVAQRSAATPPGRDRHLLARKLFDSALAIDPRNARAYSGLSTLWGNQAVIDFVPFSVGYELSVAAAEKALALDSLQGSAWANLAIMRALKFQDLEQGLELIRRAESAEPSNPEVFLIKSTIFADQIARRLDPLNPNMRVLEGDGELCADRPDAALRLFQLELELNPTDLRSRRGYTRTLAMLGRFDDALASWRLEAVNSRDTVLAKRLMAARGKDGYWNVRHAEGRRRLELLRRQEGWVSPLRLVQSTFATGDADAAYQELERAQAVVTPGLFRLRCMPDMDEFRQTPRFADAIARIGAIK
jgi:DNA-binding SARP family transcriptional activator/TolB-like protein